MAVTKFVLGGSLGRSFGREHKMHCHTPAEGLAGLLLKLPGLQETLLTAHLDGVAFRVTKGRHRMTLEELDHKHGSRAVYITPVVMGSKGGFGQLLVGVALVAASFFTAGIAGAVGIALSATTAATVGAGVFSMGMGLAMGGLMQLVNPQPKMQTRQDPDNKPSYAFGGPVNTTQQGLPIPVLYGEYEVGGAVLSAAITAEDTNG